MMAIAIALLLSQTSFAEIPDFYVTPHKLSYDDFRFAVDFENRHLMHNQFEIYTIAISVIPGSRKTIRLDGYLEVWQDNTFVYGSTLQPAKHNSISITLRQKIKDPNAIVFLFDLNPHYITKSWFNYQIVNDDGSVQMNCVIRLGDFIPPSETNEKNQIGNRPGACAGDSSKVQVILETLNSWDKEELDVLEHPDKYPGHIASGETNGFVTAHKLRLKELGFTAEWNPDKKLYVLAKD